MDTQHLRAFVEVVRQGSFAGAARRLNLATSQATRAVAAIESELGARLLHRTTRKVTLTQPGAAYYEQVSALLEQLDAAAASYSGSSYGDNFVHQTALQTAVMEWLKTNAVIS